LSELATNKQIERINQYKLFGNDVGPKPSFDLHILLVDFRPDGRRANLTNETEQLAKSFKEALGRFKPELFGQLGDILCLEINTTDFEKTKELTLRWKV